MFGYIGGGAKKEGAKKERIPPIRNYTIDLTVLDEREQKALNDVIERDVAVNQAVDQRVTELRREIQSIRKAGALRTGDKQNRMCARCKFSFWPFFMRPTLVLDTGARCMSCKFRICKKCRFKQVNNLWLCSLCLKQRQEKWLTGEWLSSGQCRGLIGSDLLRASLRDRGGVKFGRITKATKSSSLKQQTAKTVREDLNVLPATYSKLIRIDDPVEDSFSNNPKYKTSPRDSPTYDLEEFRRAALSKKAAEEENPVDDNVDDDDDDALTKEEEEAMQSQFANINKTRRQSIQTEDQKIIPHWHQTLYKNEIEEIEEHKEEIQQKHEITKKNGRHSFRKGGSFNRDNSFQDLYSVKKRLEVISFSPDNSSCSNESISVLVEEVKEQQRRQSVQVEENQSILDGIERLQIQPLSGRSSSNCSSNESISACVAVVKEQQRKQSMLGENNNNNNELLQSPNLTPRSRHNSAISSTRKQRKNSLFEALKPAVEQEQGVIDSLLHLSDPSAKQEQKDKLSLSRSEAGKGDSYQESLNCSVIKGSVHEEGSNTESESDDANENYNEEVGRDSDSGVNSGHTSRTATPEQRHGKMVNPGQRMPVISVTGAEADEHRGEEEDNLDELFSQHKNMMGSRNSLAASSESLYSIYSDAGEVNYGRIPVTGEVQFHLDYSHKNSVLEVHLKACKDLAPVDTKRNRSDPYIKTYLLPDKSRGSKRKSKIKKHTLNPNFDEILKYPITKGELESRSLWLTVWHSDRFGRNDFLGEVTIPMDYYDWERSRPAWYTLQTRTNQEEDTTLATYKGDMMISLKYISADQIEQGKKKSKKSKSKSGLGELHANIREAQNLTAMRGAAGSNPFCKGYLLPDEKHSSKQKTPVIKKTTNPKWGHTLVFEGVDLDLLQSQGLELTIWDHEKLASNDFLGGVRLNLGAVSYDDKTPDWMDARAEESEVWRSVINHPNEWIDAQLPLRASMGKQTIKK